MKTIKLSFGAIFHLLTSGLVDLYKIYSFIKSQSLASVKSDLTVSIGYYKKGLFLGRAPELIGDMINVDIGIELVWTTTKAYNKLKYILQAIDISKNRKYIVINLIQLEVLLWM